MQTPGRWGADAGRLWEILTMKHTLDRVERLDNADTELMHNYGLVLERRAIIELPAAVRELTAAIYALRDRVS